MSLVNWIRDRLSAPWYFSDEWAEVRKDIVHVVVDEYDAPSWDLKVHYAYKYRNKDTGETRWRLGDTRDFGETHTVFKDPTNDTIEWDCGYGKSFETRHLSQDELHDNS